MRQLPSSLARIEDLNQHQQSACQKFVSSVAMGTKASQSASVGSQSVTKYSSSPSMAFTSLSSILKPSTFAFSTILSFFTLFGSGTYPFCKLHLTNS